MRLYKSYKACVKLDDGVPCAVIAPSGEVRFITGNQAAQFDYDDNFGWKSETFYPVGHTECWRKFHQTSDYHYHAVVTSGSVHVIQLFDSLEAAESHLLKTINRYKKDSRWQLKG